MSAKYECNVCFKRLASEKNLAKHQKSHEGKDNPTVAYSFHCTSCLKSFKTAKGLAQHTKSHNDAPAVAGLGVTVQSVVNPSSDITPVTSSTSTDEPQILEECLETDDQFPDEPFLDSEETPSGNLWDDFDEEIISYIEEEEARIAVTEGNPSGQDAEKTKKRKPLVTCPKCKHSFYTVEGYIHHEGGHALADLMMLKGPDKETVLTSSFVLLKKTLMELKSIQPLVGQGPVIVSNVDCLMTMTEGDDFKKFHHDLTSHVYEVVIGHRATIPFMLPTELKATFTKGVAKAMGDCELRAKIHQLLLALFNNNCPAISLMIPSILRLYSNKLIAFYLTSLIGDSLRFSEMTVSGTDNVQSLEFQQNIHYIGGANVKSVLDTARRYKENSDEWKRVFTVLKENFMVNENNPGPSAEIMAWTSVQDRGGLVAINGIATEFFVKLATLVKPMEKLDGSLINSEVFQKVCSSPDLLVVWNNIVKESLLKKEAYKLLHALCSHFCVTWRNGVIGRRMGIMEATKKVTQLGKGGVAFRAGL